ncbi:hypothetical protein APY04_2394 [Hyphomicrobium sulfonivorans]|uniref:Uncharacterized protein n=1 Tax=Hyphomicrobium sulfonivorans TaxID=121290 RepID=A0A109BCC0_HYPSL|nr:hypothetical protein APY04_2394 [Hyphomicrobium sulfonivorans]
MQSETAILLPARAFNSPRGSIGKFEVESFCCVAGRCLVGHSHVLARESGVAI